MLLQGGDLNTAIDLGVSADNSAVVKWGINTMAMNVNWDKPILGHVLGGNTSYQKSENVITLEKANEVCTDRPALSDLHRTEHDEIPP